MQEHATGKKKKKEEWKRKTLVIATKATKCVCFFGLAFFAIFLIILFVCFEDASNKYVGVL